MHVYRGKHRGKHAMKVTYCTYVRTVCTYIHTTHMLVINPHSLLLLLHEGQTTHNNGIICIHTHTYVQRYIIDTIVIAILDNLSQFVLRNLGRLMRLADCPNQYAAFSIDSCSNWMADKRVWWIKQWRINENSLYLETMC